MLSRAAIFCTAVVGTLAWLPLTLLPYEVAALAQDYSMGATRAGWIVAGELLALAASAAWSGSRIAGLDIRRTALIGIAMAVVASAGSATTGDVNMLVAYRLLFGAACGLIASATNAVPGLHAEPERIFAHMQVAVGIVFGSAIYAVGAVSPAFGRVSVFVVTLMFLAAFGAGAMMLPRRGSQPDPSSAAGAAGPSRGAWACIIALGLMWAALAAIWAFAEQAGVAIGMPAGSIATWMSIGGFLTPLGALLAASVGERLGYVGPIVVGIGVQVVVAVAMYCTGSHDAYIAGLLVLNPPITFTTTYLMSLAGSLDSSGRSAAFAGAAVNVGGAAGPALGAIVLSTRALTNVGWAASAVLVVGIALAILATHHWRRREAS